MSEKVLSSLMHFFAIFLRADAKIDLGIAKNIVIFFLQKQFDKDVVEKYTDIFIEFYNKINNPIISKDTNLYLTQSLSNGFLKELFISLPFKQRIFLIVNLLFFRRLLSTIISNSSETILRAIDKIVLIFKLNSETYKSLKFFISGEYTKILDYNKFLTITGLDLKQKSEIKKHIIKKLKGQFFVLRFNFDFFLICYKGTEHFYLDNKLIIQDNPYIISNHSIISSKDIPSIYFNDLLKTFLQSYEYPKINFLVKNIEYKFNKKLNGLHPFSFECKQNEMIGIIGSSGVGKSTLLKLLCGILPIHTGEILINNCDLQTERNKIKDFIGYIPQEEVLFEDLTVFENILFHAKLCMKIELEKKMHQKILELLENLGLYDIKDYKVGTISHKIISGGQRKRLNIALELIRDPNILFIDEPTSGLSSSDAEKIITLLKQQVLKGKLIFINLHQPSDQVLRLFDQLIVIDKGGFPVYFGHPGEAYMYLVKRSEVIGSSKFNKGFSESEKILEILEDTTIDEFGNSTVKRKIEPHDWYRHLRDNQQSNKSETSKIQEVEQEKKLPEKQYKTYEKPSRFTQFLVYLIRNYKTRIANKSYILISLFVSPILAIVLAFFCRQMILTDGRFVYIFNKNENIPSFIFMCIIVALFIGLMSSAEEIIRNKRILMKEAFLNLSSISYLSSKLLYLLVLSMIQTLAFTIISYIILKFNNGFFIFWFTLLSISFLANILGLIISTLFNTTVAVYIIIPFIIIPQILLSGTIVKYDNINPKLSSIRYTPVISDMMPTRWAYELLMVDQFMNNKYQRNLFDIEMQISNLNFKILAIIPELRDKIEELNLYSNYEESKFRNDTSLLINELCKLGIHKYSLRNLPKDKNTLREIDNLLQKKNISLVQQRDSLFYQKDIIFQNLITVFKSRENLANFKDLNFNTYISKLILQRESFDPYTIWENEIIQKTEPIYKISESSFGRAHFFASHKRLGKLNVNTIYFNFLVTCIYSIMLIILLFMLFRNKYRIK